MMQQLLLMARVFHLFKFLIIAVLFVVINALGFTSAENPDFNEEIFSSFAIQAYIASGMIIPFLFLGSFIYRKIQNRVHAYREDSELTGEGINYEFVFFVRNQYLTAVLVRGVFFLLPSAVTAVIMFQLQSSIGNIDYTQLHFVVPGAAILFYIAVMIFLFPTESRVKSFIGE
ncbi:MAG: hypothetical protein OEZ34_05665 [Spirochaetia bacterium]|nr:hypothetical protein [Spirochaetia bacterium]